MAGQRLNWTHEMSPTGQCMHLWCVLIEYFWKFWKIDQNDSAFKMASGFE